MVQIIIICIFVYLLSVTSSWLWIHKAYSKNGIWNNLDPDRISLIITYCPIVNTIMIFMGWIFYYPIESGYSYFLSKHFNIKK